MTLTQQQRDLLGALYPLAKWQDYLLPISLSPRRAIGVIGRSVGILGRTVIQANTLPESVVDNLESNDSEPFGPYAPGETLAEYYRGDTGAVTRASSDSIEGDYYLEVTDSNGPHQIYSISGDGLPRYPKYGEIISFYVYDDSYETNNPGILYGVDENNNGINGYLVYFNSTYNYVEIQRIDDGGETSIDTGASVLNSNTLYEIEIEWHNGSGSKSAATHVVNTYSVDATDLSRTGIVDSFSVLDDTYTTNTGIGWRWNSNTQSTGVKTHDNCRVHGPVK